jgi:hydroxymethylpyrimidine pyrophosphatase-like HAD family hydrolase
MKFLALATDYDGTIAQHGDVTESTHEALRRWKESGRKLLLVTGREFHDLEKVCPFLSLFDVVVAENGALLHWPARNERRILAAPSPEEFIASLRARGVTPLAIGEVVVATLENYKGVVLEAIEEMDLKLKVILNKGAVMVLPVNVDKTTGLLAALAELNIAPADIVGVGDAENDQSFLGICGYSAAVANALSFLKKQVHYVTRATHGAGVEELIEKLLAGGADESKFQVPGSKFQV